MFGLFIVAFVIVLPISARGYHYYETSHIFNEEKHYENGQIDKNIKNWINEITILNKQLKHIENDIDFYYDCLNDDAKKLDRSLLDDVESFDLQMHTNIRINKTVYDSLKKQYLSLLGIY